MTDKRYIELYWLVQDGYALGDVEVIAGPFFSYDAAIGDYLRYGTRVMKSRQEVISAFADFDNE